MNSVYLLIHTRESEDGSQVETVLSAHSTESFAISAGRYFRNFGDFKKHEYENTYIQEVEFTS